MNVRTCLLFVLSLCVSALPVAAQNYIYATGSPVCATTLPIDHGIVNVNNGEIHLEIPLATKPQRGDMQLNEKLIYDSRIWKIIQNGGSLQWSPTNVPNSQGGWTFSSGAGSGNITFVSNGGIDPNPPACQQGGLQGTDTQSYTQYSGWTWTDPSGTAHSFPGVSTIKYGQISDPHCLGTSPGVPSSSAGASDGSGYFLNVTNFTTATVTDLQGRTYTPQVTGSSVVDRNGNYWSTDANGNLIDTSGLTPVVVTTSGNQTFYDVLGVQGARERYTITMESILTLTAFDEPGVNEVAGRINVIQSVALPDGSSYAFTYYGGTGVMETMTLPSGGVITYGYSRFMDSFNNVTEWLTSITRDGGVTTFTPAVISKCSSSQGCQEKMTVAPPDGNATVYTFTLDKAALTAGSSWISGIQSYQGTAGSGQLLRTTTTSFSYQSYNISTFESGVNEVTGSYEVPTGVTNTVALSDVGLTSKTATIFFGFSPIASETKAWDFYSGSTAPSLSTTDTVYGFPCYTTPSSVTVKDGSGNQLSSITYGFDEAKPSATSGIVHHNSGVNSCNMTSEHQWVNTSGTTLNTTMTYNDTGALLTSTSPSGTTTYGYDPTHTFVTSTTSPPVPSGITLETQTSYDASTGAVTSTTDENGQKTTYSGFDMFNRPTSIAYPDGGSTTIDYLSPTLTQILSMQNSSQTNETQTQSDGYGRVSRVATAENAASNVWYQRDTCYDTSGRTAFASYSYQGAGFGVAKVCSGAGDTTSYDALSRPLTITHGDGTSIKYQYTGRATKTTDENGVARIAQTDAFGRPISVCELTSSTMEGDAPGACGTDIAGTGFLTSYAYNLASHLTTVTQGEQTRIFQTDSLGRSIFTSEPERGQTSYTYAYNSTGLAVTRTRPQANQSSGSVTTTTTTQYDSLGRVQSIGYSDGTPERYFAYDVSSGWANFTQTNVEGRLAYAYTLPGISLNAGTVFSYGNTGRVVGLAECSPGFCGSPSFDRHLNYSYDLAGNLTSASDAAGTTLSYTYTPANEVSTISSSASATALISNVTQTPNGPLNYAYGNGLTGVNIYDINGHVNGGWVCQGSSTHNCPGGVERYGYSMGVSGARLTSMCDDLLGGCYNLGYDPLNRMTSRSTVYGTTLNGSWSYDRYGNRWTQNVTQGGNPQIGFNKANNWPVGFSYDAAGDMTSDGIHAYTYDAEGNVTAVDGGSTATYTYDALNRRVRSVVGGVSTEFVYDAQGKRVSTWNGSTGTLVEESMYWGGMPLGYVASGAMYYQHEDWEGTVRVVTNAAGATVGAYGSLPFGDGLAVSGTDPDPAHFALLDHDDASATEHAQFREYSSGQGHWMSPDPYDGSYDWSDPQSYNRYAYVMGNPLASVDPSGLFGDGSVIGTVVSNVTVTGTDPLSAILGLTLQALPIAGELADIGLGVFDLGKLFGFWDAPQFHGSLQPRPSAPEAAIQNGDYIKTNFILRMDVMAPSNQGCSVLDTNCNNPGPVEKYGTFLACEAGIAINDLGDAAPASYGALAAGAVGIRNMSIYMTATKKVIKRAGLRDGVPVIGEIAALYDSGMALLEAIKVNQECTALVYGH